MTAAVHNAFYNFLADPLCTAGHKNGFSLKIKHTAFPPEGSFCAALPGGAQVDNLLTINLSHSIITLISPEKNVTIA